MAKKVKIFLFPTPQFLVPKQTSFLHLLSHVAYYVEREVH